MAKNSLYSNIVIHSWKTYEAHTLNTIRDCLIMWHNQRLTNRISKKCPIDYYAIRIEDDKFMYCLNLTKQQVLMWKLDNNNINKEDRKEIFHNLSADDYCEIFND